MHPLLAEPDVSTPVYKPAKLPAPRWPLPVQPMLVVLGLLLFVKFVIVTPWKATPEVSHFDRIFTPVMAFRGSPCEGCVPASWQPAAELSPSPKNRFRRERIHEALLEPARVNDYQKTDVITETKLAAIRMAIGKALSDLPDRVARMQTIRIRDISMRLLVEVSKTDHKKCRQYRVSLTTAGKKISGAVLKACPFSLIQSK